MAGMMTLPTPTSFTIPSVHDDTTLDCRLYLPRKLFHREENEALRAAIVAHPYAPLGGSYDDSVVYSVSAVLVRAGYIVATFNFRGASGSAGRTSWTSKPELGDYASVAGFMVYYLNGLDLKLTVAPVSRPDSDENLMLSPIQSQITKENVIPGNVETPFRLILAGYSYGSLIARHLPSIDIILRRFTLAAEGSAEAEIQLRANHLSRQANVEAKAKQEQVHRGRNSLRASDGLRPSMAVAMGGYESESTSRRISRESRRSIDLDGIRRSVDRVRDRIHSVPKGYEESEKDGGKPDVALLIPNVDYLLISPILPPLAGFTTMFTKLSLASSNAGIKPEQNLVSRSTLAICGDKDFFIAQKKWRAWAEELRNQPGSQFRFREIHGAGHFWHEEGVMERLQEEVREWVSSLA